MGTRAKKPHPHAATTATTTAPTVPASTTVNTDLKYGILNGVYVNYKVLADGREEIWSSAETPKPVYPAGTVQHPILGVAELGAIKVSYWVNGSGQRVVYYPTTKPPFGQVF